MCQSEPLISGSRRCCFEVTFQDLDHGLLFLTGEVGEFFAQLFEPGGRSRFTFDPGGLDAQQFIEGDAEKIAHKAMFGKTLGSTLKKQIYKQVEKG